MSPHRLRNAAANAIRDYFKTQGFLEVITPLLVNSPAIEPHLDAFEVRGEEDNFWLPTSPEFGLKKTLALEPPETKGIFEIAHVFRDDRPSRFHAPEFTMVEWYERQTHYLTLAERLKQLLLSILTLYNQQAPPIKLYTIQEYCSFYAISIPTLLEPIFEDKNYLYTVQKKVVDGTDQVQALAREFELFLEEKIQPVLRQEEALIFLHGFPAFSRGMAELDPQTGLAQRLECFYRGIELANGYQEIADPYTVEQLFIQCNQIRKQRGLPTYQLDETLLYLTPAMQGVAGMALGLERLLMAFFGISDIAAFRLN